MTDNCCGNTAPGTSIIISGVAQSGTLPLYNRLIVPSDSVELDPTPARLEFPEGGWAALEGAEGVVTLRYFTPGEVWDAFSPTKVRATGTTATVIWGYFTQ